MIIPSHSDREQQAHATAWVLCAKRIAGRPMMRLQTASGKYPQRYDRTISEGAPNQPAAVHIYGTDGCCTTLCLDLDAKTGHDARDVERDTDVFLMLAQECDLPFIIDESPSGGRHIYIPLAHRLPYDDARALIERLAIMLPTLDASPHQNIRHGLIRPPGSRHSSGGHQSLLVTVDAVSAAFATPANQTHLAALNVALPPLPRSVTDTVPLTDSDDARAEELTTDTTLTGRMAAIASDGTHSYRSDSEARAAVLAAAVRHGMTRLDIVRHLENGAWPWLTSSLIRKRGHHGWRRFAETEIASAERFIRRHTPRTSTVSQIATSETKPRGGSNTSYSNSLNVQSHTDHEFIRTLRSVVETVRTTVFVGRGARARYWVLRAVLEAMHKKGSATIDFGQRSLSLSAGLNHQVVGRALRELCTGEFACLELVQAARGTRAHKLRLIVPESLRDVYASARFAKGLAHGMRPIFRVLGHDAALVYEAIEHDQADTIASLCMVTGVSRAEIYRVLDVLTQWELIELVVGGGWRARGEMLAIQAERAGVMATIQSAIARFRAERRLWWLWLVARETLTAADYGDGLTDRSPTVPLHIQKNLRPPENSPDDRDDPSRTHPPHYESALLNV